MTAASVAIQDLENVPPIFDEQHRAVRCVPYGPALSIVGQLYCVGHFPCLITCVKPDRRWLEELREREHVRNRPTRLLRPIRLRRIADSNEECRDLMIAETKLT